MNILIIEENDRMRRAIRSLVSDIVDETYECGDLKQALDVCREQRPDWVVIDVDSKEMNGMETVRCIKEAFPEIRIITINSYDGNGFLESNQAAGVYEYVLREKIIEVRNIIASYDINIQK